MLTRLHALIVKELIQMVRDRKTMAVILFLPMFLLIIFGYAVNFDVHNIKTAVYDQDMSEHSRAFLRLLSAYEYFDIVYSIQTQEEIDELFNQDKVQVVLVIPRTFSYHLLRDEPTSIQCLIDGVNGNTGQNAGAHIIQMVQNYNEKLQVRTLQRYGKSFEQPIELRERIWFNPELKTSSFLVPGLIAFILMITAVISTAMSVVREKELNTIEQIIVSPARPLELMIAKTVPFMFLALLAGSLVFGVGHLLFDISIKGDVLTLIAASLLFLMGALGQGVVISSIAPTQAVAFMAAVLSSLLPTLLLSGFIFRLKSMPLVLQLISYLIPARYFLDILRGVILKGTGFSTALTSFTCLVLFMVLMVFIGSKLMSRQM